MSIFKLFYLNLLKSISKLSIVMVDHPLIPKEVKDYLKAHDVIIILPL